MKGYIGIGKYAKLRKVTKNIDAEIEKRIKRAEKEIKAVT